MRREIMSATCTAALLACLTVASSHQEVETKTPVTQRAIAQRAVVTQEAFDISKLVSSGKTTIPYTDVFAELSAISFTTESDNKADFERNHVEAVAAAYENIHEDIQENIPATAAYSPAETASYDAAAEEAAAVAVVEETETQAAEETVIEETEVLCQNRWGIQLNEDEIELLARIVWIEARGESVEGQKAVIEVIFNRITSNLFPNTLYDVLSQKNPVQFCSWKKRNSAKPTEKEYNSISEVLNGNTNILRENTLYFSTSRIASGVETKIGNHYFCY